MRSDQQARRLDNEHDDLETSMRKHGVISKIADLTPSIRAYELLFY